MAITAIALSAGAILTVATGLIRNIFFFIDVGVYSLISGVYSFAMKMYDINNIINNTSGVIGRFSEVIYSFLAIAMFFKVAFSLLEMLVDPSKIEDKEKGASKIVINIILTLVLIVGVPVIFEWAAKIQQQVVEKKYIENAIYGDDFKSDNDLGNQIALTSLGIFINPTVTEGAAYDVWYSVFGGTKPTDWKATELNEALNEYNLVTKENNGEIIGANHHYVVSKTYSLSYLWFFSTIFGIYLLWVMLKLAIDIAYRAMKFSVLQILSPIAIVSFIDPSSSKKGVFSKWVKECFKTYLSLFVRIFVFALATVIISEYSVGLSLTNADFLPKLIYFLAAVAFLKYAPKFIDELFGTEISKGSETKFATDLLRGGLGAIGGAAVAGIGGAVVAKKAKMSPAHIGRSAWEGIKKGTTSGFTSGKKGDLLGYGKSIYGGATGEAGRSYYGLQSIADEKKQNARLSWAKENAKRVAAEAERQSFLKTNPKGEEEFRDKLIDTYKNGTERQKKIASEFLQHMGMAEKDSTGNLKIFDSAMIKDKDDNEIDGDRLRSVLKTDAQRARARALYGKAMASTEIFSENSEVGKQMQDNAMHSFTAYREQAKSDLVAAVAGDFGRQFDLSIKTGSLETLVGDFKSQLGSTYVTAELKGKLQKGIDLANDGSKSFAEKIKQLQPLISEIETGYTLVSKNAAGQNQYYTGKAEDASKALGAMKKDPRTQADAMVLELAKEGDPYLSTDEIKNEARNLNNRSGYHRSTSQQSETDNRSSSGGTYTSEYDKDNMKTRDSSQNEENGHSKAFNILMKDESRRTLNTDAFDDVSKDSNHQNDSNNKE